MYNLTICYNGTLKRDRMLTSNKDKVLRALNLLGLNPLLLNDRDKRQVLTSDKLTVYVTQ